MENVILTGVRYDESDDRRYLCADGIVRYKSPIIKKDYETTANGRLNYGWVLSHCDVLFVSAMLGIDAEDMVKAFEALKNRSSITIDGVDVDMCEVDKMNNAYMDMVVACDGCVDEGSLRKFVNMFHRKFGSAKKENPGGEVCDNNNMVLGKDDIRRLVEYIGEHRGEIDELQMSRERVDGGSDLHIQGGCSAERRAFDEVVSKSRDGGAEEIGDGQEPQKEGMTDIKRKHR